MIFLKKFFIPGISDPAVPDPLISPVMVRNIIAEGVAVSSYTHRGLFSEKYKIIK